MSLSINIRPITLFREVFVLSYQERPIVVSVFQRVVSLKIHNKRLKPHPSDKQYRGSDSVSSSVIEKCDIDPKGIKRLTPSIGGFRLLQALGRIEGFRRIDEVQGRSL